MEALNGPCGLAGIERKNDRRRGTAVMRETVGLIDEQMVGLGEDRARSESATEIAYQAGL